MEVLAKLLDSLDMFGSAVAGVSIPAIFRKVLVKFGHEIITIDFGDNTRQHYLVAFIVSLDQRSDGRIGKL